MAFEKNSSPDTSKSGSCISFNEDNFFEILSLCSISFSMIRSSQPMKIATTMARIAEEIICDTGRKD